MVGQMPKDKPSVMQAAACPNCGDKQFVYGETILSITLEEDGPDQNA